MEFSDAVKRRNGKQTGGRRLALHANLRPPLNTLAWLGLAWFDLVILHTLVPMKVEQSVSKRRHIKLRRRRITQKKAH